MFSMFSMYLGMPKVAYRKGLSQACSVTNFLWYYLRYYDIQ
jgi:hypothetical protein